VPDFGQVNVVALLGGPFTLAGFAWLARMFIKYQRDFTDQYRRRMSEQDQRIERLEGDIDQLRGKLINCIGERQALRVTVSRAGIDWDPGPWGSDGDTIP
jgi:hypothetical protein